MTAERARAKAKAVDAAPDKGPLAGVPFAVKNLFDVAGIATVAGSKINRAYPPATRDAALIERLEAAGAVLVGALNMGEYAYDFTGENVHDGPSRNPHDVTRMSGGSSGGSGGAVGGGHGAAGARLRHQRFDPRAVLVLRHFRPEADLWPALARAHLSVRGEPRSSRAVRAHNARSRAFLRRHAGSGRRRSGLRARARRSRRAALLERGLDGLRIAVAGGYFKKGAFPEALEAVARVAKAVGASDEIEIPEAARARAAAYVITATEGAALHLDRLRKQARDFDPAVRDRLIAGAMVPAALVAKAQIVPPLVSKPRCSSCLMRYDAISRRRRPAPRPSIGQQTFVLDGVEMPLRPNVGIYTQPISFVGLPVAAVPVPLQPLPIGVQIIAAPWREDVALRIAYALEQMKVVAAPRPAKL